MPLSPSKADDNMPNMPLVSDEDELPIAIRRKRRSGSKSIPQCDPKSSGKSLSAQTHGLVSPPETPHRAKKRVRISEPDPSSSTGLTPSLSRNSLSSSRWYFSVDGSLSATMQYPPFSLGHVSRVERYLVPNSFCHEDNFILVEEMLKKKSVRVQLDVLKQELRQKDHELRQKDEEIAYLRNAAIPNGSFSNILAIDSSCTGTFSQDLDDSFEDEITSVPDNNHEHNVEILEASQSDYRQPLCPSLEETVTETPSRSVTSSAGSTGRPIDGDAITDDMPPRPYKLRNAAIRGNEEMVRHLSDQQDIDLDPDDESGSRKLWCAARDGVYLGAMQLVKRRDVDVNSINNCPQGYTPLMIAARNGHENIVQLLLEKETVRPNIRNELGETALRCAAASGNLAVVKLFLERHDVDTNAKNARGETTLWSLASSRSTAVAELLLTRKDVDPNEKSTDNKTPLMIAAKQGNKALVQLLLRRDDVRTDIQDNNGWTALTFAADSGHEDIVDILLKLEGEDMDQSLSYAALSGHEGVVRLILKRGITEKSREKAIEMASSNGQEAVALLLKVRQE